MTLTVEDGSVVAHADTFLSLADARALAADFGITLATADSELEVHLRKAFSYLSLYETKLSGTPTDLAQTGIFPRKDCYKTTGYALDKNTIPTEVKMAQIYIAEEYAKGTDAQSTSSYDGVESVTLTGILSVAFNTSDSASGTKVVIKKAVDALRPYLRSRGGVIRA